MSKLGYQVQSTIKTEPVEETFVDFRQSFLQVLTIASLVIVDIAGMVFIRKELIKQQLLIEILYLESPIKKIFTRLYFSII